MNGRCRFLAAAAVKGALCAIAVVAAYRAALACGLVSDVRTTFATPADVIARDIALELAVAALFCTAAFALGARYALIYALFLGMELAIAYLCRAPVGVYEFVSVVSFPALYAAAAFLAPRGPSALSRALRWAIALLALAAALQSSCTIAYVLRYGGRPSPAAVMAALKTNGAEARGFIVDQFGLSYTFLAVALGLGVWAASLSLSLTRGAKRAALSVFFFVAAAAVSLGYRSKGDGWSALVFDLRAGLKDFRRATEAMELVRGSRDADLAALNVKRAGTGELCVVVIGESANRAHMQCYGYGRPTTPWMSSAPVTLFTNAYSCMTHTDFALTMALSRANDYTLEGTPGVGETLARALRTPSLPEVLRAAGTKTVWITNHRRAGVYNRFVTAQLALNTDEQFFTQDLPSAPGRGGFHLDGEMLPMLRAVLDAAPAGGGNLTVFVNVFGSHWPYSADAPRDWPYMPPSALLEGLPPSLYEQMETYDRSVSYTDWVLGQIFDMVQNSKFPVCSMLYFADHSEDIFARGGHNFDALTPAMTTIPLVFWCSPEYERRWPETVACLRANKDKVFTSDLAFELVCGVAHVTFDGLDERLQLTSPRYAVTPETARFWQGRLLKEVVPDLGER